MPTTQVDVRELPTRWEEILSLGTGTDIIILDDNVPRARLILLPPGRQRVAGMHRGAIQTTDDFDAPLPEDFWLGTK